MLARILIALLCLVIGFTGAYAVATLNLGLLIVSLLAIVLVLRMVWHDHRNAQPEPDVSQYRTHTDPALEAARERFLREPTIKQVMPNLGGGQEL